MENVELVQGLYGSQISRRKVVGYCMHHKAALTAKTLKAHECLKKQCNALKKCEEHAYWKQRDRKKLKKQKTIMLNL